MSAVLDETAPAKAHRRKPPLTDDAKRSIAQAVINGESQVTVAERFGVHRNTVSEIMRSVRDLLKEGPRDGSWKEKLQQHLPSKAVAAVEASINDREDVHKAASTGIAVLKGIGALQGDGVNVTIQQVIGGIPSDMLEGMVTTPGTLPVVVSEDVQGE